MGENDKITPPEVAIDFDKLMPNTKLYWLEECGHAPMMEQSKQFNEILYNWTEKIKT